MESLTLGFGAVVLMGLAFGAGPCNITCLPYLGPVFVGQDSGRAWRTVVPFSLGRLFSYSALGAVAGGIGHIATEWLTEGPAALVLGTMTIFVGLLLWRRAGQSQGCSTAKAPAAEQPVRFQRNKTGVWMPFSLFGMGMAMALNPCLPLGTVLLAAAAGASAMAGLWLGFGFGIGAVLVPSLIFGILVAHFGTQIRLHLARWGKGLERGAGVMLIMLGAATAMGWIQP